MSTYDIVRLGRTEIQIKAWSCTFREYRIGDLVPTVAGKRNYCIAAERGSLSQHLDSRSEIAVRQDQIFLEMPLEQVRVFWKLRDAIREVYPVVSLSYYLYDVFLIVRNRRLVKVARHWKKASLPLFSKQGNLLHVVNLVQSRTPAPPLYHALLSVPVFPDLDLAVVADSPKDAVEWFQAQIVTAIPGLKSVLKQLASGGGEGLEIYDVAFTYASENREYVKAVARTLRKAGISIFHDEHKEATELWGHDLVERLGEIYQWRSRLIVMFISCHYVKKAWPTHERLRAQARQLLGGKQYILPARFDDTSVPGLRSTIGYIDLRKTTVKKFAAFVLEKLRSSSGGSQ